MRNLLPFVVVIVVHVAADVKTSIDNPGYDVTPLSKRMFPAKMRSVFSNDALISANPLCREDAATLCAKVSSDNLLLLPCMQSQAEVRILSLPKRLLLVFVLQKVSHSCHQVSKLLYKNCKFVTCCFSSCGHTRYTLQQP